MRLLVRKLDQCDETALHILLQHALIIILGIVVVEIEMLHTHQMIKLDPFLQIRCLIFKDRADGNVVFLILRLYMHKPVTQLI